MPTPVPSTHWKLTKLLRLLFFLSVVCCLAYGLKTWVRPLLPRLVNHGLYLGWLMLLWRVGANELRRFSPAWLHLGWHWTYLLVVVYLALMEGLSFVVTSWAKPLQSSIAHTAFIFSSSLPLAALICVYALMVRSAGK